MEAANICARRRKEKRRRETLLPGPGVNERKGLCDEVDVVIFAIELVSSFVRMALEQEQCFKS